MDDVGEKIWKIPVKNGDLNGKNIYNPIM